MPPDQEHAGDASVASDHEAEEDLRRIFVSMRSPSASRFQRQPRNYLQRNEQRRLFWMVMPPAILFLLLGLWVEQTFFQAPAETSPPQVDTRLPGGPRGMSAGGIADAVVIEPDPEPFLLCGVENLGAPVEALSKVRDDTVFREADSDAWFAVWETLRQTDPEKLDREAGPAVGFTELFAQPRSFRGRLVRLRGTFRRIERVEAAANAAGITNYWQGWLDPDGGPPSPIVIYFLTLPKAIRPGTRLFEPVEVVGYFFKRWAYQATDAIRTAPLVMSLKPVFLQPSTEPPEANILETLLWTGGILAVLGTLMILRRRGKRHPRRAARVVVPFLLGVMALSWPRTAEPVMLDASGEPLAQGQAMTADDYLGRFDLAAQDRNAHGPVSQWDKQRQKMSLRILARLRSAPAELVASWSRDAVAPARDLFSTDPAADSCDRLVRVVGRAVLVHDLQLSGEMAERHGQKTVSLVRLVDADGLAVDLIADHVPRDWPRETSFSQPADAVGILVARQAGPRWEPGILTSEAGGESPAITLVTSRISWRPGTPLGSLGMDYGLFDAVQDGQKLVSEDADAFYGMLAAVGRGDPEGLETAAAHESDVLTLIDPQTRWLENNRGSAVRVRGTARRAIRIAIDDPFRRSQLQTDHYWEVFVFVRTPTAVQVNGRLQDSYPFVCCFRELPPGMPTGERIAEEVEVSGFALKRYRYQLFSATEPDQRQESPLIISRSPRWIRDTEPVATRQFDRLLGSGLVLLTVFLIAVGWATSRRPRRFTGSRPRIAPPPIVSPENGEDQDRKSS